MKTAHSIRLSWPVGGERPVVVLDFGPDCEGGYPAFTASDIEGAPSVRVSYACHPDGLCDTGDFTHETRATYLGPDVDLPIAPANTNRHDLFRIERPGRYTAPLQQGLVRYVRLALDIPGTAVTISDFTLENRGTHATEPSVGTFECTDPRLADIWRMSVRTCQLAAIPAREAPVEVGAHCASQPNPAPVEVGAHRASQPNPAPVEVGAHRASQPNPAPVEVGAHCASQPNPAPVEVGAHCAPTYAYLSDGAKRDRLVWSGDLWWAQRNMYAAWGYDSPYMPGSLRMLAENRTPEGYIQACPYPESHGPLASGDYGPFPSDEFAAWFIPVLWDHTLHSGDRNLAFELFPAVCDLVAYLRSHCRTDGLFEQRPETSKHASALDFGEASVWHRAYMNILLWKTYRDAASLADWLGEGALATDWRAAADALAPVIRTVFWDAEKGRFLGALEGDLYEGEANALALATRFCTPDEADAIRRTIVRHPHGKFQALFIRGLFEYGFADDAMAHLWEHGWKDVLDPAWQGPWLTSECMSLHTRGWGDEAHPDTAIAGILTNYILGVEPTAPGFATYNVRPQPSAGVTSASGIVPTPWGRIHISWRLDANGTPVVECREERLSHS